MSRTLRYVQFATHSGVGYALFALDWKKDGTSITSDVGAAFCHPTDSFVKSRARDMAVVRLEQKRRGKSFTVSSVSDSKESNVITNDDFLKLLPQLIKNAPNAPNWAKKCLKDKTFKLGLSVPEEKPDTSRD